MHTLDAHAFPSRSPLLEPSFVHGDWNRARGYVIHSPVAACVQGGLTASPAISPHYSLPRRGEAD